MLIIKLGTLLVAYIQKIIATIKFVTKWGMWNDDMHINVLDINNYISSIFKKISELLGALFQSSSKVTILVTVESHEKRPSWQKS